MKKQYILAGAAGAVIFAVMVLLLSGSFTPGLSVSHTVLAANGSAVTRIVWILPEPVNPASLIVECTKGLLDVVSVQTAQHDARELVILLAAGHQPGEEQVLLRLPGHAPKEIAVRLVAVPTDPKATGFPDQVRLSDAADRERFRQRFGMIAESQFYERWDTWDRAQQDCAGLVRFAYREALKVHDEAWYAAAGMLAASGMPDIAAYSYPDVPLLGTRIFRIRPGSAHGDAFTRDDFAAFCTARYLMQYNARFVSFSLEEALPGDMLFFDQADLAHSRSEDAMHIMVYLGTRMTSGGKATPMVVYHTGDPAAGEVRRLPVSVLNQHPDDRWHPVEGNPNFLGVFRWIILL